MLKTYFEEDIPLFVLAVSGGIDSMCMMHAFCRLGLPAVAIHINYGKRGEASDKDAELVRRTASEWGLECHVEEVEATGGVEGNFQQWAREVRYRIFQKYMAEYEAGGIAVAHHRDDQIETILQKLFRGAGLESWSAMQVWDGEVLRPLLGSSRKEIEHYAEEQGIPYRTDQSNLSSEFARNFLRNEWLDGLEQHFPGWEENVLRLPEQADLFSKALDWIREELTGPKNRIAREPFLKMEKSLAKALLLHRLKEMEPGISVTHDALSQVDELHSLQTGKSIQLTENYSLMRDREWFKIVYEQADSPALLTFSREELAGQPFAVDDLAFSIEQFEDPDFEECLYLDASRLEWPLTLRRWKRGDRFQPLGMEGHQKVADHLTNRKISASYKGKAFVLETFDETICAVIFPPIEKRVPPGTISERYKCDAETRKSLTIKHN